MKIVVIGATGGTGMHIVRQALAQGHNVTAVVGRPDAITRRFGTGGCAEERRLGLSLLEGAFDNAHAVLSAVGARVGRRPTRVYSEGMRNIRAQMTAAGVRRVIAISSAPLSKPSEKRPIDRLVAHPLMRFLFRGSFEDLRRVETELVGRR